MAISETEMNFEREYLNSVTNELRNKISEIGSALYQQEEKVNCQIQIRIAQCIVVELISIHTDHLDLPWMYHKRKLLRDRFA